MGRINLFLTNIGKNFTHGPTPKLSKRNVALLAFVIAAVATLLNSSWMYNRLGELDHFAYLGAAVYFPNNLNAFPTHPVTELAPTYLFTALLYHLFLPATANFIKDQLSLTLALYAFINISLFLTNSTFVTLCVTVILSGYYYFLASIGSDYTDCFIQLFCLIHLFLIKSFFDSKAEPQRQSNIILTLGVASALMFSSGVLSIVYIVNLIFLFILLHFSAYRELKGINLVKYFGIWLLGAFITIALLSIYLYALTGGFYMKYNLNKLFNFVAGAGQFHPLLDWLPYASWLILPCALFLFFSASISCDLYKEFSARKSELSRKLFTPTYILNILIFKSATPDQSQMELATCSELAGRQRAFIIFLVTTSLSLIFIQTIVKQWSLQFMYFSQINFIYFLGLAIILSKKIEDALNLKNMIFIGCVASSVAISLNLLSHRTIDFEMIITNYFKSSPTILPWLALVLSFLALISLYVSGKIDRYFLIFPILFFHVFSYSELHGGFCCIDTWKIDYLNQGGSTSQKFFDANFKIAFFLNDLDTDRSADVWFDEKERLGPIMRQVFSMNYFNNVPNMINKLMPQLGDYSGPWGSGGHAPVASRPILILSEDVKKIERGLKNLENELQKNLEYEAFAIKIGATSLHAVKTTPQPSH